MDVEELITQFVACTLPKQEWTHQAHLTVGLWHVQRYGAEGALERLRTGIRRLNDSHGTPNTDTRGYHETITRAYVLVLSDFLDGCPGAMPLPERVARLLASPAAEKDYLLGFYSSERLMSPAARSGWSPPEHGSLTARAETPVPPPVVPPAAGASG